MSKMKMIMILGGLAVVSFVVSFVVSSWLTKKPAATAATQPAEPATQPSAMMAAVPSLSPKERQLDELVQELKARMESCRKKEAELEKREKRLAMAQESLTKQAKDVENQLIQLKAPLANLQAEQRRLKDTQVLITSQEGANLKKTAAIYEKMDAASGGKILENMCTGQQEDDAARILHFMSEKSAAKVLMEITDKNLVAKLTDKLKRMKEEG